VWNIVYQDERAEFTSRQPPYLASMGGAIMLGTGIRRSATALNSAASTGVPAFVAYASFRASLGVVRTIVSGKAKLI
jgi:hypothetical protein